MVKRGKEARRKHAPTVAPGMNTHDPLEAKASRADVEAGEATPVTRLYLDRTPGD